MTPPVRRGAILCCRELRGAVPYLARESWLVENCHATDLSNYPPTRRITWNMPIQSLDLVLLSDTHELHREATIPSGEILVCCGDFTMFSKSLSAIKDFNDWLGELPHRHKIVIPGNHEFFLEADERRRSLLTNATVLINEGIELEGLRIWGSPVSTSYGSAFGLSSPTDRARHWAKIPEHVDVLVTHGPPYGVLDCAPGETSAGGDPELRAAVERVGPLLHAFGHIHPGYGQMIVGETTFVNCALLGEDGAISKRPVVMRLPRLPS